MATERSYNQHISELKGSLRGVVMLQGRSEKNMSSQLKVQLFEPGKLTPALTEEVYTDNHGEFLLPAVVPGKYVLTVKQAHTLQLAAIITIIPEAETFIKFKVPLLAGDANGDNQVSEADFLLLSKAFGTYQGGKGYNSVADFNMDASISVLDFSLLAENYNKKGYSIHKNSYTELSSMATADLYLLIVNKVFFRRYYASK